MTTFYILRHGETDSNTSGSLSGHENVPLNKTDQMQVKEVSRILKDIHFDEIISSDLERAVDTVKGIAAERNIIIKTTSLLREKGYGSFEGRTRKEVEIELKELFDIRKSLSYEEQMKFRMYHDGETDEEAVSRFMQHLREVAIGYPNKTILVGSHGGIMWYFLIKLGWAKYSDHKTVKNASYIVVDCDGVEFFLKDLYNIAKE